MQKELNIYLSIYMKCNEGDTKDELDDKFYELMDEFCEENGMEFQIYESELQ